MSKQGTAVIVTTAHRGVFFGHLSEDQDREAKSLTLTGCRNIIRWLRDTGGFLGLAADGPCEGSVVGKVAPNVLLHDVTSVTECTSTAARKLETWP